MAKLPLLPDLNDPSKNLVREAWDRLAGLPGGKWAFSKAIGRIAPYSGTIGAVVEELRPGFASVSLEDRPGVRNHLDCVHAIALVNLAEIAGNLALSYALEPDARFIVAGLSIGIFVVPLTFIYLDFRYALPFLQPVFLWSAPILYDSPDAGALHWVNRVNPLTYLINVPREWLTEGWRLEEIVFPVTVGVSFALLALGLKFYRHAMPRAIECLPRR